MDDPKLIFLYEKYFQARSWDEKNISYWANRINEYLSIHKSEKTTQSQTTKKSR